MRERINILTMIKIAVLFFITGLNFSFSEDSWVKDSEQASLQPEALTYLPLQSYAPSLSSKELLLEDSISDLLYLDTFGPFEKIGNIQGNTDTPPTQTEQQEEWKFKSAGSLGWSDVHSAFEDAASGTAAGENKELWWKDTVEHPKFFSIKTGRRPESSGQKQRERPIRQQPKQIRQKPAKPQLPITPKTVKNNLPSLP